MTKEPPQEGLISWNRHEWAPASSLSPAAHPNARFCVNINQCPVLDKEFTNPNGVPISGILFGGRRSQTVPLVYQCFNWNHGVFTGTFSINIIPYKIHDIIYIEYIQDQQ